MTNKLVLIDGNSIAYRAFFALPLLNNDKGVYTNAVYGFTTMLLRILEDEKPTHLLVAFDAGKTTFRHKTYGEYKGGRQKTPSELSEQFPLLKETLDAFNIKHYQLSEYEADDIIGTLATQGQKEDWEVNVISGDKDLLQLVSDRVKVSLTKKGLSEVDTYTPVFMEEKLEISPDQVIDMKALMGDASDNIPGVPGVGQKTAVKLLKQYQTLENLYEHIDEVSGKKLKEKLENHKDDAFMSKELVTIKCDSPIEIKLDDIQYTGYEANQVSSIFKELGFQSLLTRLEGEVSLEDSKEELNDIEIEVLDSIDESIFTGIEALEVEMLGDSYHVAPIEGIGLVNENKKYFIPTDVAVKSNVFKKWAEDSNQKKWVFDAKKVTVALLKHDIHIHGISFDLLLASYLIDPSENHHDIPAISHRFGKKQVLFDEEVYGKGAKLKVPEVEKLMNHVTRKANMIYLLKDQVEQELTENSQLELLQDLELPLSLVLGEMESTGVQVDVERLKRMGEELQERLKRIESEVHELAGEKFNINSPKQLGPILFEKLELPVVKKTKTGYSTSADVLEQLQEKHPIIPKLLMYRQLGKLQSTYIEGLLKVVHQDENKIHTRFNQALTQTGRLSSIEPNLQNIPIRLEEGKKIREAFIPSEKDWYIFAADYSQIELRVLAHIAKDEKLTEAFQQGMDIHTRTAMDVFHVSADEITDNMRRQAKAVNFGIVYGISDYGLSQNLGITRKEAKLFIDRYLDSYPGVQEYMSNIIQDAKQHGYVTTLLNRRRYLPDITSRNFNVRSFAERTAMNTPIQGTAADIIKLAMIDLHAKLKEENLQARMLLQVHDELILEAPEEELERLKELVPMVMENAIELAVPLKVDYAFGRTWYDAK
ncbi:DNA polymerase I [Aquibacillus koreensis]|uniref:DNA polymerase I n=1 Tax=Aquibacillus koreensis TaxID=279446 RepID=A0A9X3WIJ4_9BACI|nr:DNA polymerase I [Aquibacillus koreensis]MCT2537190.1 DNA polymerase I [Aquibacillus koreensis]MDC3419238.1 DNA polymerase I [Aquibacillus koreensis]